MNRTIRVPALVLALAVAAISLIGPRPVSAHQLDDDSQAALKALYASSDTGKKLGENAKGVLVFPKVTRAGFIIGGAGGDGVLYVGGKKAGYYNTSAGSVGLQAGVQTYAFAIFFMTDAALHEFQNSSGWEVGVGPTVVVVDAGAARDYNTLTGKADIFGMIFDQSGLMAGMGLVGTKISKIER